MDYFPIMNLSTSSLASFEQPMQIGEVGRDNHLIPYETTSGDFSRILHILENAEDVIHMDRSDLNLDSFSLEPTPIGPQGMAPRQWYTTTSYEIYDQDVFDLTCIPKSSSGIVTPQPRPSKKQRVDRDSLPDTALSRCQSILSDLDNQEQVHDAPCASSPPQLASRFRQYQSDQWMDRFEDLLVFKRENGHCLVPHNFPPNQQLAQWTKRQRYQYKLKNLGRHSTLTDQREKELDEMGFIWDSHRASWHERLVSLKLFHMDFKHTNVPSNYEVDKPLAVWVKCQRRQMKLFRRGVKSTMTKERIDALEALGFDWNPRNL